MYVSCLVITDRQETKTNRTFGGECRSYTISRPFEPFRVPTDARFDGRSTFGVSLAVDMFSGDFSGIIFNSFLSPVHTLQCMLTKEFLYSNYRIMHVYALNLLTYTN